MHAHHLNTGTPLTTTEACRLSLSLWGNMQLYGSLCAILPAMAYPFMPHDDDGAAAQVTLGLMSAFSVLVQLAVWLPRLVGDHPVLNFPPRLSPLSVYCILISSWKPWGVTHHDWPDESARADGEGKAVVVVTGPGFYVLLKTIGCRLGAGPWRIALQVGAGVVCVAVAGPRTARVAIVQMLDRLATRWWLRDRETQNQPRWASNVAMCLLVVHCMAFFLFWGEALANSSIEELASPEGMGLPSSGHFSCYCRGY